MLNQNRGWRIENVNLTFRNTFCPLRNISIPMTGVMVHTLIPASGGRKRQIDVCELKGNSGLHSETLSQQMKMVFAFSTDSHLFYINV